MGDRTRGKQIKFWADEKEFEQIKKKVEKSKLSQQDYLLKCALNKKIIIIDDIKELVKELKRIGNNLNQLTRSIHTGDLPNIREVEKMNKDLEIVWNEVIRALRKVNK
ncbi:plasmid mobilization protein [Clostridium beijerinckii]|uniref:plasmid mobilization protein n=2 Tax=Clostridium beijerinckii TaxID=1520 RepID=UPI00098C4A29|nr:plasmid mobilization relaxosome protein MobC [Clostridium beijerinckii]MBA8937818.1 flagellin-specific chaperone FliS [Clostridium beijerinckii]NRU41683.1 flagellin-specific chaperone FliS [Clostridium beijerinckii]NSB00886.1 flagellin-specific chaperone FliS [Clostridium beijerinckii]OOM64851.1 bacterial mobilization protein (MobC) [Clostridium beijerinckii]CUU51206.1 MobC, Bacterial mobilisation protein [Clostridium beijerinckii]